MFFNWSKLNFNDQMSLSMNMISQFHDLMMIYIMMILISVLTIMWFSIKNTNINLILNDFNYLELIWTVAPMLILVVIMIPSMKILYSNESIMISSYNFSLKVMAHQWFWTSSMSSDLLPLTFLSNMEMYLSKNSMSLKELSLYNVDNKMIIPLNLPLRVLVSSADVIHSWAIPSLGMKVDAIPGRLNQVELMVKSPGVFFGQCSEICGMNHSMMPFMLVFMNLKHVLNLTLISYFFS